jgi:hypothetical protein
MNLRAPIKLNNKLSKLSIFALVGLAAFAVVVLVANPFANHTSGSGATSQVAPSPLSATTAQPSNGSPGSLLTTPVASSTGSGTTHHDRGDDGNSTGDS